MSAFPHALKEVRRTLGLSQAALAGQLGSTQRHVSFLETGRSNPTTSFVIRLCRELRLSVGQRSALFEASGLANPYPSRGLTSQDVAIALDVMERRILQNWPFPGVIVDRSWNLLRMNAGFKALAGPILAEQGNKPNLFSVFTHPMVRDRIVNWDEAAEMLYFRLQRGAAEDEHVRRIYEDAKASKIFAGVEQRLTSAAAGPVLVPLRLVQPDGTELQLMSLIGRMAMVHDAMVDGFEIELMLPADDVSDAMLRQMSGM